MTPEQMERVSEILEAVMALDPAARAPYLDEVCAGDPDVRREVVSLMASHEAAGSRFLNEPPLDAVGAALAAERPGGRAGRRIGAYLILDEVGHGGMGEVFRAVRADGQYEKTVALKLVRSGYDTAAVVERFRNERQILAALDHPNIARLLDGGTTEDGVPYLVMELVDGEPIDRFCDARALSVADRLQLFLQVCAAVQYAHQHLVIHRDIKPANLLVTPDGTPKLLDFGIARLLDPSGTADATILHPFTPAYASPEQIAGDPISTATDVYSLAVVLYELLAGRSPYSVDMGTPAKLAAAISHQEPQRPGAVRPKLRGDLDFILLKALRKEPGQRYASVEQFAEDIRRHLEGRPVAARKGTWHYRTGKFVRRHRTAVAAAALVLLTLVTGVVVTVREARVAEANRRRAEARFNDVRSLARSLIFEVHDSIQDLPGATKARKIILQRSLEYLDRLAQESGNEPDLQRELATAYGRIATLQGDPQGPNLGDTSAARASFQKALQLRESLAKSSGGTVADRVELAIAYLDYGEFLNGAAGNVAGGFDYTQRALTILEREATATPDDSRILAQSARAYTALGMMQVGVGAMGSVGTASAGVADLQKALVLSRHAAELSPSDTALRREEAVAEAVLGEAMFKLGERSEALVAYRRALDVLHIVNRNNDDSRGASNVAVLNAKIGDVLVVDGQADQAIPYYTTARSVAMRLSAADPGNEQLRRLTITNTGELGHGLAQVGRTAEGLRYLREALSAATAERPDTPLVRTIRGVILGWLGETLERQGRLREALNEYAAGKELIGHVHASGVTDVRTLVYFCALTDHLGAVLTRLGRLDEARTEHAQALMMLEPLGRANPDDPEVLYALGEAYTLQGRLAAALAARSRTRTEKAANWRLAQAWFEKSLGTWGRVSNPARMSTSGFEATPPGDVSTLLARANAQIASLEVPSSGRGTRALRRP